MGRLQQTQSLRSSSQRRDRGLSISSQEGANAAAANHVGNDTAGQLNKVDDKSTTAAAAAAVTNDRQAQSNKSSKSSCICGVVSLLECVPSVAGGSASASQQQHTTTNKKATELRAARRALR